MHTISESPQKPVSFRTTCDDLFNRLYSGSFPRITNQLSLLGAKTSPFYAKHILFTWQSNALKYVSAEPHHLLIQGYNSGSIPWSP